MNTTISLGQKLKALMSAKPLSAVSTHATCDCCGAVQKLTEIQEYQKPNDGDKYWQCDACPASDDLEESQYHFSKWLNK